jgi:S-DNA-T family DNA segregation ATPase FtsK/SpoIIIE
MDSFLIPSLRLIVESQVGATSLLQRKLNITFKHAGEIMDQLEKYKVVGAYNGRLARKVLVKNKLISEMIILGICIREKIRN